MFIAFAAQSFNMYLISLFATKISFTLNGIGDIIYNDMTWYNYSNSLQRYVLLIIKSTHEIRYFTGYKIFDCNLETFMKVNIAIQIIQVIIHNSHDFLNVFSIFSLLKPLYRTF